MTSPSGPNTTDVQSERDPSTLPRVEPLPSADELERQTWSRPGALLRLPRAPAAPPNRLRRVLRVLGPDGRVWFAKLFTRTPLSHVLRNRTSAPRCHYDAEREAHAARILIERGFETARPVALGSAADGSSIYVCAELTGRRPIGEVWAEHGIDPTSWATVVTLARSLIRAGIHWPDLAVDHVWVSAQWRPGAPLEPGQLALIDLHDVTVRSPGARLASRGKRLRRMLRRADRSLAARSLRASDLARLRAATRLLAEGGVEKPHRRRIVERLAARTVTPSHARYDPARADRYRAARDPARVRAERALLESVWPTTCGAVLDSPCGAGRLADLVTAHGGRWTGADRSPSMLAAARDAHAGARPAVRLVGADALHLPFDEHAFDGAVCFRFLHHLPPTDARRAVAELARIAERFVVVSHFHPVSAHEMQRRIRLAWSGGARTRFTIAPRTLDEWFAEHGLQCVARRAQSAFLRDLWVARYERAPART